MKDFKVILAALGLGFSILIIGLFTISVFNYIAFLKEENHALMDVMNQNILQLQKSIGSLESESLMQQLVDLKAQNISLRQENERLVSRLERYTGKRRPEKQKALQGPQESLDKESKGNRGFLFRRR